MSGPAGLYGPGTGWLAVMAFIIVGLAIGGIVQVQHRKPTKRPDRR